MAEAVGAIRVNLVDGTRRPFPKSKRAFVRILDGRKREVGTCWPKASAFTVTGLPFYDNLDDNYTVIVHADGYQDAGIYPVRIGAGKTVETSLMLIPKDAAFHFQAYRTLKTRAPRIARLIEEERYTGLMEDEPVKLGALFTIASAIESTPLADKSNPLDLTWQIEWDLLAVDRFWAWVDASFADRIAELAALHSFAPEPDPDHWHPGIPGRVEPATRSWKQTRFDVANVQLSFHEKDTKTIGGTRCVMVEPDMDYYKDLLAHGLLEVLPNLITKNRTDARAVYVLRWMACRQEALPDFAPPCTLE
jgi:hypothetical protein